MLKVKVKHNILKHKIKKAKFKFTPEQKLFILIDELILY